MGRPKRFTPLEKYLIGFDVGKQKHQDWLIEIERAFAIPAEARRELRDQDYRASLEVAEWLDSPDGQPYLDSIQQRWGRAFPQHKKTFSASMPLDIHRKLERLAKKRKTSKNSVVFRLIAEADAEEHEPSIAERFDKLEQSISDERKKLTQEFRESECRKMRLQDGVSYLSSEMRQIMNDQAEVPKGVYSRELYEFSTVVKAFHVYCQQNGVYGDDVIE
ncbi:hypothetical protein [Vibrio crassostreae]|uniref:hypothetical protein n=1 Tax=Vibrio crassostreae TaxID=246167 RepID=UPI0010533629|nr:hypothetical protein [Vibrio crassostreae]TCT61105.1 hypothetical protein EDB31_14526 [Vibrio crassostreae]